MEKEHDFIVTLYISGAQGGGAIAIEQLKARNVEEALGKAIIKNWKGTSVLSFKVVPALTVKKVSDCSVIPTENNETENPKVITTITKTK